MKIHDGKLDDFKALATDATDLVKQNEPNMQGYNWCFGCRPEERDAD